MLQKKTKASQSTIAKELQDAFKMINKIKGNLILEEMDKDLAAKQDDNTKNRKGAKSQQTVARPKKSSASQLNNSIDGFGPFSTTKWETSQEMMIGGDSTSMNWNSVLGGGANINLPTEKQRTSS